MSAPPGRLRVDVADLRRRLGSRRAIEADVALDDVSVVEVSVLTEAPGLSPEEVEQRVTFPIEAALNGVPQLTELRSVSRSGLSAVTIVAQPTGMIRKAEGVGPCARETAVRVGPR